MTRRDMLLQTGALMLQQSNLDKAARLVEEQTTSGGIAGATLFVREGSKTFEKAFGVARSPKAVYLLASITKPMTASAVMLLSDRGQLSLADPVQRFVPEFQGAGRERVTIKHLLTHTSGLPDMLPENVELRKRHAPLADFVAGACKTPLLFAPGTDVRYQSMGILLAAEIVSRVTKSALPAFLQKEFFGPLGMKETSLGLGRRKPAETMAIQVDEVTDWDWNSSYWRDLASPWGGAHAPAADVGRFLRSFAHPEAGVLKPETAAMMIRNQTEGLKQRWGLGWSLDHSKLGKNCSPGTFGHGGSTGTLSWHDPKKDRSFVLLCTMPADKSNKTLLHPTSDIVSA